MALHRDAFRPRAVLVGGPLVGGRAVCNLVGRIAGALGGVTGLGLIYTTQRIFWRAFPLIFAIGFEGAIGKLPVALRAFVPLLLTWLAPIPLR